MIGKCITSDVFTYSSLIQGLCNVGRWDEDKIKWKQMYVSEITQDLYTHNILVDTCCKEGKIEGAESIMKIMSRRGRYMSICCNIQCFNKWILFAPLNGYSSTFFVT